MKRQGALSERPAFSFLYYFLIEILILIRKASPDGAACFVIYKERNHKTSLIGTPIKIFFKDFNWSPV